MERYAFLWKKHKVSINRDAAHLVKELEGSIDREPYTLLFTPRQGKPVQVFTIHAVPTTKGPINEVMALVSASALKDAPRALVAGDFNLGPEEMDKPFEAIGYKGHIVGLTSLRRKVNSAQQYLSQQYDNIYSKGVEICSSGVVDFVAKSFGPISDESLARALKISDHIPVFVTFR